VKKCKCRMFLFWELAASLVVWVSFEAGPVINTVCRLNF
jgi:hypothetical protein